jgi:F0F1-type ATP synthase assembly protein I
MEPPAPRSFAPAEAGALLAGVTLLVIGLGVLVGWLAGSLKIGLIIGAVLGLPAGVGCVYVRYRESF